MFTLEGKVCRLRALEPDDLDFLYLLENNPTVWEVSNTITPYSRAVLKNYLGQSHRDIFEVKQLRLCICNEDNNKLGLIDLFDFDPKHQRAGLGIVIASDEHRNKGIGKEAITLVLDYAFSALELHQIYANILEDNEASIHLFEKLGFQLVGIKKDWIKWGGSFKNELLYQKLNT